MKRFLSLAGVLLVLGCARVFAFGVGLQGGLGIGNTTSGSGAVTFKLDGVPCVFAVSVPSFNPFALGVTADWWIGNPVIQNSWHWFYGVGLAGAVSFSDSAASFAVGARALIGTDVFLLKDVIEFYAQVAWQPMIVLTNGINPNLFNIPIDLGFRFWF